MKVEVLISCMYQTDTSIINKTNIQSDVVIINQCDTDKVKEIIFSNKQGKICKAKFISTTQRGLSRSRNMAIQNSSGDICLLCDDDEVLEDDYVETITKAFEEHKDDLIAFKIKHPTRKFKEKTYKIGFFKSGTIGSWQLTFKRKSITANNIKFNEKMGSGTGNGAGEENKFVMDCYKKGLDIRYVPYQIGELVPSGESQWFKGYDKKYWVNRGWQSKMVYGRLFGFLYIGYFLLKHKADKINGYGTRLKWMLTGFSQDR